MNGGISVCRVAPMRYSEPLVFQEVVRHMLFPTSPVNNCENGWWFPLHTVIFEVFRSNSNGLLDSRQDLAVCDDELWPTYGNAVTYLRCFQSMINRADDSASPQDRVEELNELNAVRQDDSPSSLIRRSQLLFEAIGETTCTISKLTKSNTPVCETVGSD